MSKVKEDDIVKDFDIEIDNNNNIEQKEEICKVLWIKEHAFAIDFKGYGISFHVSDGHVLDTEKIGDYIKVKTENEIGSSLFKIYPIYD